MKILKFFDKFEGESLTYDDLILLPRYVDFGLGEMSLSSQLTREIRLNSPIVSSPMDTVTEASLAIAVALQGGLGILHYNMSPEEQLSHVRMVKRYKNGFVQRPLALPPTATIEDVIRIKQEHGYSIIPITETGQVGSRLLGMVTKYHYSAFSEGSSQRTVAETMTATAELPVAELDEVAEQGHPCLEKANRYMLERHAPALPIVDKQGQLVSLITRSDMEKQENYELASVNPRDGSLLVGAAVETWPQKAQERLEVIADTVDVVVFDTSQGYTKYELDLIRWTKQHYPHLQVIGGNVVTQEACEALIAAGVDGIRIGMGSGSICTTQEVGGVGRGQVSALYQCGQVCLKAGVPLIADGGIAKSADMIKAMLLGASTVMLGSLLACTEEAPGRTLVHEGVKVKSYEGMGSLSAMARGSSYRYSTQNSRIRMAEGVAGKVTYKGPVSVWVPQLIQGMMQGMHKLGVRSVEEGHELLKRGELELERRSEGAKKEGRPHHLYSYH